MKQWPSATWQWLGCFAGLAAAVGLAIYDPSELIWDDIAMLGAGPLLGALAIGIRLKRVLFAVTFGGAALGAPGLPEFVRPLAAVFLGLVLVFFAVLWWKSPYGNTKAKAGLEYRVVGRRRVVPMLAFVGPPPPLIKEHILDELVSLAEYADRFLVRHDIRYFAMFGTLLGAMRHDGAIPWDDDIDLVIYRSEDLRVLREDLDRLAADARRDGYVLFRHGRYFKLAKNNFWRYPVVDLFQREGALKGEEPQRVRWEYFQLSAPPDGRAKIAKSYGEKALTHAFHSVPFWDSGFVPAFLARLFGHGVIRIAARLYRKLYIVYET
jgi:hypothetical protein